MNTELFALLPDDVLHLIWIKVAPQLKYSLNKKYFSKYYSYCYNSNQCTTNSSISFNNYNYYYYLLKHDLLIFSKIILTMYIEKLISGELSIRKHYSIYYKNLNFYSLLDFFSYYSNNSNNSNNSKSKTFIIQIINKYNLTHLIKKIHKNNVNKNIRWNI